MMAEASILARLEALEAEGAIRATLTRYMALCEALDAATPTDELGNLFTEDAVWAGRGKRYAQAFGERVGRAAIVAMIDAHRTPPHFALNAHFLSSETIKVTGSNATGRWMMLQTSTYADGRSDLRSARLSIHFTCAGNRWQISRFETENIFSRPIDRWDDPAAVPVPDNR